MKDSVIACSRVELMVVSRDLFMKALNVSLSILKRRNRDREKRRAQSVIHIDKCTVFFFRTGREGGRKEGRKEGRSVAFRVERHAGPLMRVRLYNIFEQVAGTRASAVGNNTTNGRQSIYGAGGVIGEKAVPTENDGASSKNGGNNNNSKSGKNAGSSHVGVAQEGGGDGRGGNGDGAGGDGPMMDEEEAIAAGLALTTSWPWLSEPAIKLRCGLSEWWCYALNRVGKKRYEH